MKKGGSRTTLHFCFSINMLAISLNYPVLHEGAVARDDDRKLYRAGMRDFPI